MKSKITHLIIVTMLCFNALHGAGISMAQESVPTEVILVIDENGENTIYSSEESTKALSEAKDSEQAIMELESMAHYAPACIMYQK